MKQYFLTNDNKLVNLSNVTNIVFEEDFTDRFQNKKSKIIFNFDYQVTLPKSSKKVPDYVYSVYPEDQKDKYLNDVALLNRLVNEKNWIAPIINGKIQKIINPEKISFMTTDEDNLRIIINLNIPVSFHMDYSRLTSDFVYLNCTTYDEYKQNLYYIEEMLKLLEM